MYYMGQASQQPQSQLSQSTLPLEASQPQLLCTPHNEQLLRLRGPSDMISQNSGHLRTQGIKRSSKITA